MPASARLAHVADPRAIWYQFNQYTPLATRRIRGVIPREHEVDVTRQQDMRDEWRSFTFDDLGHLHHACHDRFDDLGRSRRLAHEYESARLGVDQDVSLCLPVPPSVIFGQENPAVGNGRR